MSSFLNLFSGGEGASEEGIEVEKNDSEDEKIPTEIQQAVESLIKVCKEKDIEIPDDFKTSLVSAISKGSSAISKDNESSAIVGTSARETKNSSGTSSGAERLKFSDRVTADHEIFKQEISDNPIIRRMSEITELLQISRPDMSLRIKDGYFKFTEQFDEKAAEKEDPTKQRIETVYNGAPVQGQWQKIKRIMSCRAGQFKTIEHYPMKDVNLYLEQGQTYLVLGAPRCGKSTLLRMIAGILPEDKFHEVGGDVQLNRYNPKSKEVVWSNLVGYIDQIDRLHPYLTVKETFEFAWRCRTGQTHKSPFQTVEGLDEIKKLDEELFTVMTVMEALGLTRVKDTFVGDQQTVRGVSGGEKKRVTVGEMQVGGFPVLCMDEISTGLDAATTYDICKLLGEANSLGRFIKIVSLLQPPPETFALFDNLILLSAGKVIYSGPVDKVVPHFESLGYELPDRMDPADWLQALPTKDGKSFLKQAEKTDGNEGEAEATETEPKKHLTSDEFHEKFYESELGKQILEDVATPFEKKEQQFTGDINALAKWAGRKFQNSSFASLKLLVYRECLLWWRDKAGIRTRVAQDLLMGIIAGTLFWQGWEETTSVVGILFQSMFFVSLGAMLKVAPQYAVRGILYKQQDANFFPTWTYVVGRSLASVPSSVIDGLLYGTIVFWFVGLAHNDGASFANYIIFVLITMLSSIGIGLLFSIFSAITKDRSTGQAMMSVSIVILILFSGFTVQPSVIPGYWIWVYWLNIFAWAFRGLLVNEYDSGKYDYPSAVEGYTEGQLILVQLGIIDRNGEPFTFDWAGYSLAFCLLISLVSMILASIFLNCIRFATGKSLANNAIEEKEDENDEIKKVEAELPFQKVNLTFRDVHYTVISSIGNEKIELLKGIDGVVEAGKMTALMGSSGAGKTTLMDVLSLRKTSGEIVGDVRLNGHPQEPDSFRRCTGYVEQFDTQSAALTIRETCEFSAKLRLESTDPAVTEEATARFIDQTLEMLELTPIQNFQVGSDATGGLSFEQKKRLSIAVELVANPSIVFLDEPTSGLDARAAAIVMRGLKRIALTGRAVCATIHQPSTTIFNSFDTLLLLKRGGEGVFYGDLGEDSCHLIDYFEAYEATPPIQPGENPATWMLTTIGAGSAGSGKNFDYAGAYAASTNRKGCLDKIEGIVKVVKEEELVSFPSKFATSKGTQMSVVLKRTLKVYWRSPSYNRTRIITSVLLSLIFGSVYVSNRVPTNENDMNSRVTTIYMSFLIIAVNGMNTVLPFFELERNMYYRHKAALMYDTASMSFAYTVAEIPFLVSTCFLYTTIFYFMVGFAADAVKYFFYLLFMFLCMSIFTYLGHMFVSVSPDAQIAQGFGGLFVSNTGLFAGVLIRPENIPNFWIFMYWILPGHYILEGLLVTQYADDDTPIQASAGTPFWDYLVYEEKVCVDDVNIDCFGTAEEWVFATFAGSFVPEHIPGCIAYLVGMLVFTRLVALWALGHLNYRKT